MNLHFLNLNAFWLFWLLPLFTILIVFAFWKSKKELKDFSLKAFTEQKFPWPSFFLMVVVFILIPLVLAQPVSEGEARKVRKQGRDIIFLMDVSRSMMAEDLIPNRLGRAKIAIQNALPSLNGNRLALVAFAGTSAVKCPLTLDYGFFQQALENLSPVSVNRGGTAIGDALRYVQGLVLDEQEGRYKDIILITDGEDQDTAPAKAASLLAEKGVRMLIIGLGDETTGRRIPVKDEKERKSFLTFQGKEVWSRLDSESLKQMAAATNGSYLNVSAGSFDLASIYKGFSAGRESRSMQAEISINYIQRFQAFLLLATLAFLAYLLLPFFKRRTI